MGKKSVVPFTGGLVECPIQRVLVHSFRVDDIRNAFYAVQTLEGSE